MPQIVVLAIAYASYGYYAWQFWAIVAVTAYSSYQQSAARRKARNAYNESLKDRLVSVPVVDAARARVYGRVRCADGVIFKATHGTKKENFTIVLALAGHEIDAVEQVYFNDVPVTLDGSGYVTTAPWLTITRTSGRQIVTAGSASATIPSDAVPASVGVTAESTADRLAQESIAFSQAGSVVTPSGGYLGVNRHITYQVANTSSKARVRAYSGAPGQDLSTVLAGIPGITSAHKFQGIACLVIDLTYDQDAFPMGPPSVSAVVRGAKLFDPRSSTTAWTENPAIIARDWVLHPNGGGLSSTDLDDASFIAAANACDVATSFTTINAAGNSVTQTLPLFTAGLVARTDQAPDEVLGEIVAAMAGRWAWAGGRLRLRAGAYQAPVATLTEDWVSSAGDIDVVSTVPRTDLFNVLVPSIANAAQAYVVSPIPRIAPAAYIAADGGEYPREISLAAVTDTAHAAHVCGVMLRDSRQALSVTLSCNLRALVLELFDVVAVTLPRFGWSAKPFEVLGWSFTQEGGIKLSLKETDASIFNPDASFSRSDPAPNTALPNPYTVPNVAPSAIDSGNAQLLKQADGTIISRMRVTWAAVQDEAVRNGGSIELRYGPADSDASTWQTVSVPGVETQALLDGVQDGRVYVVTIRARNKLVAGAWSLHQSHVVRGKSAPPSDVAGFTATSAPGAVRLSWTSCPDADYALTELRVGTSWATATRIWRGTGSAFEWAAAPGSYTLLARHEDTSGNLSTALASTTGTALAVVTGGAALNANPACDDLAAWEFDNAPNVIQLNTTSAGAVGTRYFSCSGPGTDQRIWSRETIPLDPAKRYSLTANIGAQAGNNRNVYLTVRMFRADGSELTGADTGWGGSFAGYPFGGLPTADNVWRRYGSDFGAGVSGRPIPAAAAYCRVGFWFQYAATGSGTVEQAVQDIRLEDVTAARLASDAAAAAQATASAAQTTANTASTNATNALSRIAAIDSDGILARGEKAATILDWQALQDEEAGIVARANGYSIVTERDNYTNAKSALATYLSGLSPAWNDTSQDTTIVPAVYRANWADVYAKRQALLNKIAEVAGQRANWTTVNGRPPEENIRNNLIDLSWWRRSGTMPWAVNTDGGVGQALFTFGPTGTPDYGLPCPGPRGGNDVCLYAQEQSSNGNQAGGWDFGTFVAAPDPTKTYRFVVPIRRLGGSATAYWGCGNVCDLNTTTINGNPYFAIAGGALQTDRWYLFVGYVYPQGSTGNTNDSAGIWDCKTGQKVVSGLNFNHGPGGVQYHRAYQFYASLGAEQIFGRPMVNLVDGTEPSLREYFEPNAVLNDALVPSITAAANAASAAQTTANTASTNASSALSTLATMRSNGYLDASEKPAVIREWLAISGERTGIVAQANAYGITTERDTYITWHDALNSYLSGLSPAYNDTSTDTPITPATDQTNWTTFYNARQALLNKIADEAGKRAQRGAGDNLIPDPQFLSPSFWLGGFEVTTVASFASVNAARWSGSYAGSPGVALQCNSWGSVGDEQGGRVLVEKNGVYRLRIRVYKDVGSAGIFWFGLHIPGQAYWTAPPVNSGTPVASTPTAGWNLSAIPNSAWTDYETQVQITGVEALQVQPRLRNGLTAGTIWVTMELTRVVGTSQIVADSVTVVLTSFLAGPVADFNDI
ncbi:phage tail protein [Roseateles sp.]|uniref:phage tail protein n=1 Tax=Roseateles sp. TaxID=1971397 RepID=UPI003BA82173